MSENNGNIELPAVANNGPVMGGPNPNPGSSQAAQINQMNNVLPATAPGPQDLPQPAATSNANNMPNNGMTMANMNQTVNNMNNMNNMNSMNNGNAPVMPAMNQGMPMNNGMNNTPFNPQVNGGQGGINADGIKKSMGDIVNKIKTLDKKVLMMVGVGIAVFLVLLVVLSLCSGSRSVVNKFSKYYVKGDYKNIVNVYHEDFKDSYSKDFKDMMKDEFKDREDEDLDYKSYQILDKFSYKGDKLDDIKKSLEKAYDIDRDDIKSADQYLIKYKLKDDGDAAVDYQVVITINVKGKWYVFNVPSSFYY